MTRPWNATDPDARAWLEGELGPFLGGFQQVYRHRPETRAPALARLLARAHEYVEWQDENDADELAEIAGDVGARMAAFGIEVGAAGPIVHSVNRYAGGWTLDVGAVLRDAPGVFDAIAREHDAALVGDSLDRWLEAERTHQLWHRGEQSPHIRY